MKEGEIMVALGYSLLNLPDGADSTSAGIAEPEVLGLHLLHAARQIAVDAGERVLQNNPFIKASNTECCINLVQRTFDRFFFGHAGLLS